MNTKTSNSSAKVVNIKEPQRSREAARSNKSADSARANKFARRTEKLGKMRETDNLSYSVSTNVNGFVEIYGQLVSITESHVVFRHKRARGTKIVVTHFDKNAVAMVQGGVGEPSRIMVNTLHTIFEVKSGAQVRYLKNGFAEVVEPNGDRTLLNTTSNSGLIHNVVQGDEEEKVAAARKAA